MSIAFGHGSAQRGLSTHEKYAEYRADDTSFLLLDPRVGANRACLRSPELYLSGSFGGRHGALARVCQRPLSEASLPYPRRDGARLSFGFRSRLLSGHGRGAEPLRRVFLLPIHRDVPVASQGGARTPDRGLVRPRAPVPGCQRGARRLFPAACQYHGGAQVDRRGPHEPHALTRGEREPGLLDAQTAERSSICYGRARCRHDLCVNRRDRCRVRRGAGGARYADPEHEFQHGRLGTVLGAPDPFSCGTVVKPMYSADPPAYPLLGPLGEGTTGAGKDSPMKQTLIALFTCLLVVLSSATLSAQTSKLRVGFCARTISSAAAPFAVATKLGWYKEDG